MEDQSVRSSSPPLPGKGYYNMDFDAIDGNISIFPTEKEIKESSSLTEKDQENNSLKSKIESIEENNIVVQADNQSASELETIPKKRKSKLLSSGSKHSSIPVHNKESLGADKTVITQEEGEGEADRPNKSGLKKPKSARPVMSMSYDEQAHREMHKEHMRTSSPPLSSRGFYNIDSIALEDSLPPSQTEKEVSHTPPPPPLPPPPLKNDQDCSNNFQAKTESSSVKNETCQNNNQSVSELEMTPKVRKSRSTQSSSKQSFIPLQRSSSLDPQRAAVPMVSQDEGGEKTVRHRKSDSKKARPARPMSMSYDEQCMPERRHLFDNPTSRSADSNEKIRRPKSSTSNVPVQDSAPSKDHPSQAEKGFSPSEKDLLLAQKNIPALSAKQLAEISDSVSASNTGKDLLIQKNALPPSSPKKLQQLLPLESVPHPEKDQPLQSKVPPPPEHADSAAGPKLTDLPPARLSDQPAEQSTSVGPKTLHKPPTKPSIQPAEQSTLSGIGTKPSDQLLEQSAVLPEGIVPAPANTGKSPPPQKKKHRTRSSSQASEDGGEVRVKKEKTAGKVKKSKSKKSSSRHGDESVGGDEAVEKGRERKSSRKRSTSHGEGAVIESSIPPLQPAVLPVQLDTPTVKSSVPTVQSAVLPVQSGAPTVISRVPPADGGGVKSSPPAAQMPEQDKSSPESGLGGDSGMTSSHSRDSIVKLVQVLKYSQSDWNKLRQELEIQFQAQLRANDGEWSAKLAQREVHNAALEEQIRKLKGTNEDMRVVMGEFEKTVEQLQAEKVKMKNASDHSLKDVLREKDQAVEDLRSVETAFSDLHRRYEKTKAVLEGFKQNEDTLKKCVQDLQNKVKKAEQRTHTIRTQAEDRLDRASEEIEKMKKMNASDVAKLEAALRKAHIQVESMEAALQQKVKENKELTAICDELIAKVQ